MTDRKEKLKKYMEKRDFSKTSEPGKVDTGLDWAADRPIFVIQKHDASRLHYDFRIEVDGVLKSWAVPKGPSVNPSNKRLAMPTEDHPLEYADFEGTIPKGEYGGGTVLIWDRGYYRNLGEDCEDLKPVSQQIEEGHVTIWLEGQKLRGGYALIRTGKGEKARWLLIKMNDEEAYSERNPTVTEPNSVKTGQSLEGIRETQDQSGSGSRRTSVGSGVVIDRP